MAGIRTSDLQYSMTITIGTQYIRRRSQLLRENAKQDRQYPQKESSSVAHLLQGLGNLIVEVQCKIHQQMIGCSGNLGGITKSEKLDVSIRKEYLRIRALLLGQRYGVAPMSEQSSLRSRTVSLRSISKQTQESMESIDMVGRSYAERCFRQTDGTHGFDASYSVVPTKSAEASSSSIGYSPRKYHVGHMFPKSSRNLVEPVDINVVPTVCAEASRAMAGDKTIGENYAFAGMHHIFDQHKAAVTSVKFAIDDISRLACCSLDGTISICQVIPPPATVICTLQGHIKGVTDDIDKSVISSFLSRFADDMQIGKDEPQIHGYTTQRRAETSSLLDMVQIADALHRQEGGDYESITAGGHPWQPRD
ncbi:hypothetical protein LSH36_115g05062 [Paralvinella palmiformis]|uniref:Uncharacterized protein n=1 Tax=Paralvinella palmiformis TaxID=53620 RepID=A0AAD9N8Z5_9ANNE|nr:hypothetical protein LSH36_115g05062 [Paralvinella palmiformis]